MKKDNKKRVKEKIEITLRILLLFIIVKNIGYSEENLQDIETGIEIKNKSNEVIDVSDINHGAYKEVNGLKIENSENLTVNIKEINTTLKKKRGGATGIIWGKGLENIGTKNEVYMSDGLKINVTTGELGGNTTTLVGVTNQGKLTLGENTKINVLINTKEVGSSSTAYGAELKYSSSTYFGKGSEINVSNSTGIAVGISVDSTGFSNKSNVFIGDDVKIRAEVREAKSEIKNGHWALGIYQLLGDTITIGNGLILETEITLSSGVSGQSYAVYNMANGKINIGNNAAISAKGTNASSVMGLNNNSGKMNIGKNSQISAEGTDASKVYTVCNDGLSSEVTIEDGGTITAIGENTGFVMGLYNSGKMNIGNGVKIISILNSEKEKDNVYGVYNTKDSKLNIGDGVKIFSTINSKEQKNYAYSVYNKGDSILNIGKNSEISVAGKDTNQIRAVHNDGSSSEVTIEDGSIITAIGENTSFVIGVSNKTGSIKLNGGTSIYSDGYAVYNDNGNVSITDEGYNKKIQGLIFSTKAGSITDILLDTEDSYLEGRSVQENGGVFNLGLKNNAAWYIPQDSTVTNFNIENGIVDMAQNYKGETINGKQTLSIDNTTGEGGKYILDISPEDKDQTGNKTDYIYIKKADTSQKNYVQAGKTSISDLVNHNFSDKENSSIMIAASDKNVTFEGSEFSDISNIYNYTLSIEENVHGDGENNKENENNWYVTGISKKEGEVVEKVEEDLTLNYMNAALSRLELDTIHKRLGEIRDYTSENGVWVRIVSGKMEHDKSSGKFKNDYNMLQVGYDKRKETEKGSVFTGFAVHKRDGKADFRNGDGKNHNMGISMYKSFAYNDNSYTDIIFKYSYLDNDYKNYTENNQKLEADYNTWGGSLSLEHGKKYENNAWYVTPHVQMNYTYVKGADYSMNSGVRVEQRDIKSVIGRAGIYTGHDFNKSSHFIKVGVLHEFAGEYGAKITGEDASINKRYSGRDTWIEIGIGGQFRVGKTGTTHLYYDLEKTFGSDFETNWQASIGIRIRF